MSTGPTYKCQRPGDVPPVQHELLVARAAAEEGRTIVLVEGLRDKALQGRNLSNSAPLRHGWWVRANYCDVA